MRHLAGFGQEMVIEQLIIGLLANGNILMEGLPRLAKTRAVKSLGLADQVAEHSGVDIGKPSE